MTPIREYTDLWPQSRKRKQKPRSCFEVIEVDEYSRIYIYIMYVCNNAVGQIQLAMHETGIVGGAPASPFLLFRKLHSTNIRLR